MQLPSDEVHVWKADLDESVARVSEFEASLSDEEIERAELFRLPEPRNRFVISRGILRSLLSRYLNVTPESLSFRYSDSGKPLLAAEHTADIRFNLTHSGSLVVYAIAQGRDVGIDVEDGNREVSHDRIARRFLAAAEVEQLEAIPGDRRKEAFLRCWTRKEAYVKAKGEGILTSPPSSFAVSLDQPALLHVDGDAEEIERWRLEDLSVGDGYVGAVCVEGRDWKVVPMIVDSR